MRQISKPENLKAAAVWAVVTVILCLPHLAFHGKEYLGAKVLALLFTVFVMWLFCHAWTPDNLLAVPAGEILNRRPALMYLASSIPVALLLLWVHDPAMAAKIPGYGPGSHREFFSTLPWVAVFQSLFLVAWIHAFAHRLYPHMIATVPAIILFCEALALMKYGDGQIGDPTAIIVLEGVRAGYYALGYQLGGLRLLVLAQIVIYSRFLLSIG